MKAKLFIHKIVVSYHSRQAIAKYHGEEESDPLNPNPDTEILVTIGATEALIESSCLYQPR